MNELTTEFKDYLIGKGVNLVGVGNLHEVPPNLRKGMPFGICIALALPKEIVKGIANGPNLDYYNTYNNLNDKLDALIMQGAEYLIEKGYQAYPQTREEVSKRETMYTSMLPHKTIATRSGLGWIGKCALLVTKQYGSAVRISTILTNAPLNADEPVNTSECKDCMICTKACPGEAVKGSNWSIKSSREEYFDPNKCRRSAREISKELLNKEISLCGKCIYICPYTQNYIKQM